MKLIDTIKILALSAAVVTACQKPGMEENSSVNSDVAPEAQFGTVAFSAHALETKVSVGDKVDGKYPGLWEENDAVKVVYADGAEAGTAAVDAESAGNNIWGFTLENVQVGAKARVVYPATAGFGATVTLPSAQTQSAGSSSIGKYSYALSEEITTSTDEPVKFTLNYFNAIIKINLKSTEYAAYDLKSVGFFSRGAALAGEFTVAADALVAGETTQDRVIVTLSEPASLESEQTVWMTAFPTNLTDKEVYVVATLVKDGKELVVPVEFAGAPLLAGQVNVLNVELSAEKAVQWYVGDDPRNMLGYYAYGAANTVMVARKPGTGSSTFEIDVKARGDFYQVRKPFKWDLLTKSDVNQQLIRQGGSSVYTYPPREEVNSSTWKIYPNVLDYSSPSGDNKGSWGAVAIYDSDNNLLWSFMVHTYLDVDPVTDVDCGTYGFFMDRALGQKFSARYMELNKEVDYKSFTSAAYFQWGRKDPLMYSRYALPYTATTTPLSVKQSIISPYTLVIIKDKNWSSEAEADLWGGVTGKKTAFDPCPQGYKVPDVSLFRKIDDSDKDIRAVDLTHTVIPVNFVSNPQSVGDKWIYTGFIYCQSLNTNEWSGTSSKGTDSIKINEINQSGQHPGYLYWANAQDTETNAKALYYSYNSKWTGTFDGKNAPKTRGGAVRCVRE